MSSFLSQGFQSTSAGNTSSIISGENSSDGVPLSDPAMGVSNYVGTFISGSNYSVIQIAVRCDTIVVVNVRESFTPDGEGFISHSITTTQADADGSVPTALYFYISCPYVRVEVVNTQPNNTIFQLSTKLTSASPPETATTDSGQTYTSVNGVPHLNAFIGGQTLNINVNSSALAPVVVTDLAAEASVASIDGKITACNTGAVVVASGAITETNSGTINTAVGSINTKITACNTGAVVVTSGTITETNSGTINTAVGSINTKITACNTGAVVVASGTITETNSSASKDSLASIDIGLNKTSTFSNISSVGLKSAGAFSDTFDLGVGADRYDSATFLGVCNTTSYATPNFIFQYSFNNTDFFADGVSPSFYVNGSASSFVFQRASVPSRYVRLLFTADTFLTTLQLILSK